MAQCMTGAQRDFSRANQYYRQKTRGYEEEHFIEKIVDIINKAQDLKLKAIVGSTTFRNEPYYVEVQRCNLRRPSLAKPLKTTTDLVNNIFKNPLLDNGNINVDLIKKTLSLCPPEEDLLLVEDKDHYNLLHRAVILGDVRVVEILINHGCDVNGIKSEEVCGRGLTPCPHDHLGALHLACFLGHYDVVQYLLEKGADPSLQMKVYTQMTTKDTNNLQSDGPDIQPPTPTCVISQCGYREAAFYAVLKNNVTIVKLLLQMNVQSGGGATADNSYLLHLACRVGAYECFEYLLGQYSSYVNTRDTDGLPLLLMALKNDTRFVKLLLERDCDLHVLDGYWEPGTNILHLLFNCVRCHYMRAPEGLSDSVKMCLKMGVDVNSQRQHFKTTPLHELVKSLNFSPDVNKIGKTDDLGLYLRRLGKELTECVYTVVNHGADLRIEDCLNKTPLEAIFSHLRRYMYKMSKKDFLTIYPTPEVATPEIATYVLENTLKNIKILVERGAIDRDFRLPGYRLINLFVNLLDQNIEMLTQDSVFEMHKEILETLLSAGADPEIKTYRTAPLLELVSSFNRYFYRLRHPCNFEEAQRLAAFIGILISHGAHTEPGLLINEGKVALCQPQAKSCFNILVDCLCSLRTKPQSAENLQILHMLVTLLFQHGASSRLFKGSLYYVSESAQQESVSGCYPHPEYTFLFQYLMFGVSNLAYVNDGLWYYRIFDVLYSQIDHKSLYDVLGLAMTEFSKAHPAQDCVCGQCGQFKAMLDSVIDKPRTLQKLARLVIYNSLKGKLEAKLPQLPLPNVIKEYIMSFED